MLTCFNKHGVPVFHWACGEGFCLRPEQIPHVTDLRVNGRELALLRHYGLVFALTSDIRIQDNHVSSILRFLLEHGERIRAWEWQ